MTPGLEGIHVRLEPLVLAHAEPLFAAAAGNPDAFPLTSVPGTLEGMREYIELALQMHRDNGALCYATVRKSDAKVVGSTRLAQLEHWRWPPGSPFQRAPGVPDAVEIGWTWLAPEAQRTALNTEAKLLMLGHAFEVWKVHRVTLKTDVRNLQSRANIERIGAKLDGVLRAHLPAADDSGARTSAVYSILAAEWPELRERLRVRVTARP